jgi:Heavy metal binding domain
MDPAATDSHAYTCPMHSDVNAAGPGKCPRCGMALVREGTRFALVRHMLSSPLHLAVMLAVMVALMAAAMVMMR